MKRKQIIFLFLLALLIFLYLQYPDDFPQVSNEMASTDIQHMPYAQPEINLILKVACFDCHSYNVQETPWYGKIPIVKGWIASHMIEGRKHLNFSEWASYEEKKRAHKMEEIAEMVTDKKMPLTSYLLGHPDARISKAQRKMIGDWALTVMEHYE